MKKLVTMLTFALIAFLLLGCNAKKIDSRLDSINKKGKIILGTSADYPPYEFHTQINGKDTIVGFDVSIAEEIARDLGVPLEIKDMDFDGLLAALASGNVDFVISGMTPTDERRANVDFSDVYYYAEHGILIRKIDSDMFSSEAESLKSSMIGAQRGAIQVSLAKQHIKGVPEDKAEEPHPQVKELGKLPDLIMELKNGKIDAVVLELPVAKAYLTANSDLVLANYTFADEDGGAAIAVNKGEKSLLAKLNATIERLTSTGTIERFVTEANEIVEY
ncbi:MAG TPA: transporter substrate-binding domain-containing protein [Treponema sp.]|nr:transporter substrate-binding domain-containing protein [Treponema sp.]